MTIRDLFDSGAPHSPAGFAAWGEAISDRADGLAGAFEAHTEAGLGDDVHGVIVHDWDRDGWAPFQQVVITAHGSQQFGFDVDDARGVVIGPGPEGSHRVALLRQDTFWRDAEVRSVVWGPLGAWTGNNAQQGHLHRVRQIGPNLWEGIAVWTSVVFGQDMRHLHVASVRWDGTTLWQSSNDGGAGSNDNAWIDRRLPLVSASRFEAFGLIFTQLGILPPHGYGIQPGTVVSVNATDDSFNAVDVPIQGVDPAGFIQLQYGPEATPLTVARGHVTPSGPDSQRRWCPFGMATRVRDGDADAVVVEIKRWRAGWDPEPGWDDPRVMRATVSPDSGGNVPEMALGPGLHGLWAAHFHDGSSGAWGPVTFTRLDRLNQ